MDQYAMQMLVQELQKFSNCAPYTMQELSKQLHSFNDTAQMFMGKYIPIVEMNFLTQASVNPQLSEEARSFATARLEDLIKNIYGKSYGNGEPNQFK